MNMDSNGLEKFKLFAGGSGGIDGWLEPETNPLIRKTLLDLKNKPLTRARFNQLLTFAHEAPISEAMFQYYWLSSPKNHPYEVSLIPDFKPEYDGSIQISTLEQLYWGMYRFYVDALLYFGSISTAYQILRGLSKFEIENYFNQYVINQASLLNRGPALDLNVIVKDDRYLISEMACKSYEIGEKGEAEITQALVDMYSESQSKGKRPVSFRQLLDGDYAKKRYQERQMQFQLSVDDVLDKKILNEKELRQTISKAIIKFKKIHELALENTKRYLSMVGDLDIYVATSMRNRQDFRTMSDFCEEIFQDPVLKDLNVRYFDPTLSAASHHEDKGLIECLMVKCAKILVLYSGSRDSYGKDAEAAMALSLGKPVIIYCDEKERKRFFKEVHPLSRLIHFDTGVAVGAMVTSLKSDIAPLLRRILTNAMQYTLQQNKPGYLVLKDNITESIVRLQTNDSFLRETFWNYYNIKNRAGKY